MRPSRRVSMNAAKVGAIDYHGDLNRANNVETSKFQGVAGQVGIVRSNIIRRPCVAG